MKSVSQELTVLSLELDFQRTAISSELNQMEDHLKDHPEESALKESIQRIRQIIEDVEEE